MQRMTHRYKMALFARMVKKMPHNKPKEALINYLRRLCCVKICSNWSFMTYKLPLFADFCLALASSPT